jgi:hypothetical protein
LSTPTPPSTPAEALAAVQLWTPEGALEHAKNLAKSTLINSHFRNAHNVLFASEIGRAYGLEAAVAIRNIHVFDSSDGLKTAISADLMVHLARRDGHIVHVKSSPGRVVGTLIRGDFTPERVEHLKNIGYSIEEIRELATFEEVWDQKRAANAGLLTKKNWINFTEDMMRARVKSGLVRMGASEALMGNMYTADELGADTDRAGIPSEGRHVIVGETVTNVVQLTEPAAKRSAPVVVEAAVVADAEIEEDTVVETEETTDDTVAEAPTPPDPQVVADFAVETVNNPKKSTMEKIEAIQGVIANVGAHKMNDAEVTIGDNEPEPLLAVLKSLATHLVKIARAESKGAKAAA